MSVLPRDDCSSILRVSGDLVCDEDAMLSLLDVSVHFPFVSLVVAAESVTLSWDFSIADAL